MKAGSLTLRHFASTFESPLPGLAGISDRQTLLQRGEKTCDPAARLKQCRNVIQLKFPEPELEGCCTWICFLSLPKHEFKRLHSLVGQRLFACLSVRGHDDALSSATTHPAQTSRCSFDVSISSGTGRKDTGSYCKVPILKSEQFVAFP